MKTKEIIYLMLIFLSCIFFSACESLNPYNINKGEGAYLKNIREVRGSARYIMEFRSIRVEAYGYEQHRDLNPGMIADSKVDVFTVPTGKIKLGLDIYYSPKIVFRSYAANLEKIYEIIVFNPFEDAPSTGMQGLTINALRGHIYSPNLKIEDGKAYIWIEDEQGNRVSNVVRGMVALLRNQFWFWEDLPQPSP